MNKFEADDLMTAVREVIYAYRANKDDLPELLQDALEELEQTVEEIDLNSDDEEDA